MANIRYSAHVQLQYLLQKLHINQADLVAEMNQLIDPRRCQMTRRGKVTAVRGDGVELKTIKKPIRETQLTGVTDTGKPVNKPVKSKKPVPVTYRRSRRVVI
jgi:hypothetical protein